MTPGGRRSPYTDGELLEVYLAIHRYIRDFGYAPTYEEIGIMLNVNTSIAWWRVRRLCEAGYIRKRRGARSMVLVEVRT